MMRRAVFQVVWAFLFAVSFAGWAYAGKGEIVSRLNDHNDFVRLVFTDSKGVPFPVAKVNRIDARVVEITFDTPIGFVEAAHDPVLFPEIVDIRRVSEPERPLKIWLTLARDDLLHRNIRIGNRLVLDIRQDGALRAQQARALAAAKPAAGHEEKKVDHAPAASEVPLEEAHPAPLKKLDDTSTPPPLAQTEEKSIPVAKAIDAPPPSAVSTSSGPPVVSLGWTEPFGVASFLLNNRLWIVVDHPKFSVTPKVAGAGAGFGAFERIELDDATVFHTAVLPGFQSVRAEGGDLYWRIVLAAPKAELSPIKPERRKENGEDVVFWPANNVGQRVIFDDPLTGLRLMTVTVKKSNEFTGPPARFAEFSVPFAAAGFAVQPHVDDLQMKADKDGVTLTRPGGLSVSSAEDTKTFRSERLENPPSAKLLQQEAVEVVPEPQEIGQVSAATERNEPSSGKVLYRFERWAMGAPSALMKNEQILIADVSEKKTEDRASSLISIGKMFLANARGAEAIGAFRLATDTQPGILESPDFLGLRGAAYAINGQYDLAYEDLRSSTLDGYSDVGLWRSYALARLEDWKQASEKLDQDLSWARQYPPMIAQPMLLTFTEIALRNGEIRRAEKILGFFGPMASPPTEESHVGKENEKKKAEVALPAGILGPNIAAYEYLTGEAARQEGKKDIARDVWEKLAKGTDDKYRARARLALAVLDYEEGKIKTAEAIDRLEGLRYAWKGDELEAAVYSRLGEIYLDNGEYLKGLNVLRDASTLAPETEMGHKITATMTEAFRSLFTGDAMKKVSPLDAITIYEKFGELAPAGDQANRMTMTLVDRLVEVDLLDRAAKVLQTLIDHKLKGDDAVQASLRLAAIRLLNRQPAAAIDTLNKTGEMFATISDGGLIAKRKREQMLLRARAQYQAGQTDEALSTLAVMGEDADVLRSRADIAWQTGRWNDATSALERLLTLASPAAGKPLTSDQAELLRNLAVATNLAGDRGRLTQLRGQYLAAMQPTTFAKEFDVVTRERQMPTLADRDTLTGLVSEVDIFGGFLNAYKGSSAAEKPKDGPEKAEPAKTESSKTPESSPSEPSKTL